MTRGHDFSFHAEAAAGGVRIDVFLAAHLPDCSRSFARQLIAGGRVHVNGQTQKPGYRLKPGDVVLFKASRAVRLERISETLNVDK